MNATRDPLSVHVHLTKLPHRVQRAVAELAREGRVPPNPTLRDFSGFSRRDLLALPGIGDTAATQIQAEMAQRSDPAAGRGLT